MSKEIGTRLKQERLNKKLTIDDVASKLKIRKFYLEAMEAGDFKELPGLTYLIGFIKSYAKLLEIDPYPMIEILKGGVIEKEGTKTVGLASPRMESALPSRRLILSSLAALIVVYGVWHSFSSSDSENKIEKEEKAPVVIEKIKIEETPVSQTDNNETSIAVKNVAVSSKETEKKSLPVVEKLAVSNEIVAEEIPTIAKEVKNRNYGNENTEDAKIVITANEDSWIQIRKDDELLFSKVLIAGDKYYIGSYSDDLLLDTGNAGGISITFEDVNLPVLGGNGVIIRNFVMSEDNLEEFSKKINN